MYALNISKLCKTYASGVEALKNIDLTVEAGDFFALLGANGAGKSTMIGLITTLLNKTSGSIEINGHDLDKDMAQAKLSLGLVPQEVNLNSFESCEKILLNQAGYYGVSRAVAQPQVEILLKELGLWEKKHSIVLHLSGGMKRRLMIARALVHKPKLLILDEPTAGVDVEIRRSVWEFLTRINAQGTTIVLTTHYLEEAEQLCKNIAIIDKGLIIKNTSMQTLLRENESQTIVITSTRAFDVLPDLTPFVAIPIDANNFEVKIAKQQSCNDLFALLNQKNIQVETLRNKTGRLEELFMDLIKHEH
jgi:ABC-2 type transport system ATP-binding protein